MKLQTEAERARGSCNLFIKHNDSLLYNYKMSKHVHERILYVEVKDTDKSSIYFIIMIFAGTWTMIKYSLQIVS